MFKELLESVIGKALKVSIGQEGGCDCGDCTDTDNKVKVVVRELTPEEKAKTVHLKELSDKEDTLEADLKRTRQRRKAEATLFWSDVEESLPNLHEKRLSYDDKFIYSYEDKVSPEETGTQEPVT